MRLTALDLTHYGSFRSERITFSARPGTLNLLMAPNGGGKSVLRSAFGDLLFGIGGQSPMGFRYGYPGMRILAEAVDAQGAAFSFGRRKGQGNTLIDAEGAALDPATVARLLGAVDRTHLERLFALDTGRLRAGREALLDSNGDLGGALVSGAGGARNLRAVRATLEEGRDRLAPAARRSASRPFYVALDQFVAARKRRDAAMLRPDAWKKMQLTLEAARETLRAQNAAAHAASADIARLERIRRVRPVLHALDEAAAWLADHLDAPVLDAGLKPRLDKAREQGVIVTQRLAREQEQAQQLAEQRDAVTVDDVLLAEADAIDALAQTAGAARKAQADLPGVEAEAEALRAAIAGRLRELGSPLPVEQAAEAVPRRAAATRARELVKASDRIQTALRTTAAQTDRLADDLARLQTEAAGLEAPADVSALEACVREIKAEGNPSRHQQDATRRCQQEDSALASALARVPGWAGDAGTLARLAVLSPDAYQRLGDAWRDAQALTTQRQQAVDTSEHDRTQAVAALGGLSAADSVPDTAALEAARQHRDHGWHLVYRKAFTADAPTEEQEAAFTGGQPLPLAYQRAVGSADRVADQRMQDGEMAGRIDAAKGAVREAETRLETAASLHRRTADAEQVAAAAWDDACRTFPLGTTPPLADVQAFLAAREKVIDVERAAALAAADRTELDRIHANWAQRLAALLTNGLKPDTGKVTNLEELLALADARLDQAQKDARARDALLVRRDEADKALGQARAAASTAQADLVAWHAGWDPALAALGRPPGETPGVTDDVLTGLDALAHDHRAYAALAARTTGMRQDIARFGLEAAALAGRAAPGLDPADPFAFVPAIRLRLQAVREAANRRTLLADQAQKAADAASVARQRVDAAEDALRALLDRIGAATIEAADERLRLAVERAARAQALTAAQARLAEDGDALPVDALRADLDAVPPDEVPQLIQEAAARRDAALQAAQEAAASAATLSQQMNATQDATEAVEAASDQQAAVATMGRVLEEALLHHVAAAMLDKALAAVEQQQEPEAVRRITALFAALTNGAYQRVLTEPQDDGSARLVLVQQGDLPDKHQEVEDLSEGTRDQLYLALRLAAIEAHVASALPLPFIADDILQTFDDDRALAALRVLRDMSETVQVILLTHHAHVLDLARRLPAERVHICRAGAAVESA
jgi:uncharacterized protein YhaN